MEFKNKTILVTGGAGFIGSHIVDKLIEMQAKVIIVDDLSTGKKTNLNKKARFYLGDISDEKVLNKIFKENKIQYCIHEAAKINLNVKLEDPIKDVNSSVLGTLKLLKLSAENKIDKFIYASSVAVYGRHSKLPAKEEDKEIPIYSYGIVKKCAEEYIRYFSDNYGLNYSILRYGNVYGPRQPILGEVGVIAIFTRKILKNEPLIIYGDGKHLRDYIYIDDAVAVTISALSRGNKETFNVACGKGISVMDVYNYFCSANGSKIPYSNKPERHGELGCFYANIDKLRNILKLIPSISVDEGIRKTFLYYKKNDRE